MLNIDDLKVGKLYEWWFFGKPTSNLKTDPEIIIGFDNIRDYGNYYSEIQFKHVVVKEQKAIVKFVYLGSGSCVKGICYKFLSGPQIVYISREDLNRLKSEFVSMETTTTDIEIEFNEKL